MVQYCAHRPMEEVQGFHKSHQMPPSSDYLLSIAQEAVRATENKTKMKYVPTLLTITMAVAVRQYYTAHIARWGRSMAFINST